MQHRQALQKMLSFFNRSRETDDNDPVEVLLSGPTLLQQEPDLLKEAGQYSRDLSGWAAGGHVSE